MIFKKKIDYHLLETLVNNWEQRRKEVLEQNPADEGEIFYSCPKCGLLSSFNEKFPLAPEKIKSFNDLDNHITKILTSIESRKKDCTCLNALRGNDIIFFTYAHYLPHFEKDLQIAYTITKANITEIKAQLMSRGGQKKFLGDEITDEKFIHEGIFFDPQAAWFLAIDWALKNKEMKFLQIEDGYAIVAVPASAPADRLASFKVEARELWKKFNAKAGEIINFADIKNYGINFTKDTFLEWQKKYRNLVVDRKVFCSVFLDYEACSKKLLSELSSGKWNLVEKKDGRFIEKEGQHHKIDIKQIAIECVFQCSFFKQAIHKFLKNLEHKEKKPGYEKAPSICPYCGLPAIITKKIRPDNFFFNKEAPLGAKYKDFIIYYSLDCTFHSTPVDRKIFKESPEILEEKYTEDFEKIAFKLKFYEYTILERKIYLFLGKEASSISASPLLLRGLLNKAGIKFYDEKAFCW
ncbi:MAG: hypothetical protein M1536_00975, partial [Firmicutes bacterium]|nr:hypothetical protein [Bacillota bacterium]